MKRLNALALGVTLAWSAAGPGWAQSDANVEEVIVTGLRATVQSAQDIKMDADTIVDSIVGDDISALPDRSVTETLQRIPGVTIDRFVSRGDPEHFSGEGTGVAIRGLTQVRGEINGRDGFTANGGRSLSFEDVPPELLAGVDVYKSSTADMIEGGLGGTVNLRTHMPFDFDEPMLAFTLTANHQNFIEETTPGASVLYSNRWDTGVGELGFLVDLAYSELKGRIDAVFNRPFFPYDDGGETVYIPRGADWRTERTDRTRNGFYSALQLRPDERSEYFLTVFRSDYEFTWDEDAIFVDNDPLTVVPSADSVYDSRGVFIEGRLTDPTNGGINMGSDIRVSSRESVTTDVSAGAEWTLSPTWFLSTDLQYVEATTEALDSTVATGLLAPYLDVRITDGPARIGTDVDYMSDPANYYFAFTMDHQDDNEAKQIAWRTDAEWRPVGGADWLKRVKFGLRLTDMDTTLINTGYNWRAVIQPWMRWWALDGMAPLPTVVDFGMVDQVHVNTFGNFFRGDLPVPGAVVAPNRSLAEGYPDSYYAIHGAAVPFYLCCFFTTDENGERVTTFAPTLIDESHRNEQAQETQAFYVRMDFGWDDLDLSGNLGLRWVKTRNTASGFVRGPNLSSFPQEIQDALGFDQVPVSIVHDYSNSLPSLNLRWEPVEGLVTRLALSKNIYRPDFSDMQAFTQLYVNLNDGAPDGSTDVSDYNGSASGGNPRLQPMEADQVDLSLEWYYADVGSAWLTLFQKDYSNFLRDRVFEESYNGFVYNVTRPDNQEGATIDGWELGWRHFFDWGFGVEASYTRIDSSAEVDEETLPLDTDGTPFDPSALPVEGLSEKQYTLTLMYENARVSTRLAYTWRSAFLVDIGPNGFNGNNGGIAWRLPVFQDDYGQWDGSVFFNLSDRFAIGLEANNLTNERLDLVQHQINPGNHLATSTVQDTRYALTFKGRF